MKNGTLLLTRSDIASLLEIKEYIHIVENAFRLHADGKTLKSGLIHIEAPGGEFHVKAGGLKFDKTYFAVKIGSGFFQNFVRMGLPNIMGALLLCDGDNGYPLAIMDSATITQNRTAAATVVAAKYLARSDSSVVFIAGSGIQGRAQLRALTQAFPIKKAFVYSRNSNKSKAFADEMERELQITVVSTADLNGALKASDICVTCTPSRQYFISEDCICPGTFIAAVGADSPEKQELDPQLLMKNTVVVDILEQCVKVGELHHAIDKGMPIDQVHAQLGEIVAGHKVGRSSSAEITIFDSTGTGLQDAAAAAAAYEKATSLVHGKHFDFFT